MKQHDFVRVLHLGQNTIHIGDPRRFYTLQTNYKGRETKEDTYSDPFGGLGSSKKHLTGRVGDNGTKVKEEKMAGSKSQHHVSM